MRLMDSTSAVSDFLLELYHDASDCTPDELRIRVLKNLQHFIPFDFGVWGGGRADGRLVTDLTVLDQTEALLGKWDAVAEQDAFCDMTLDHLGSTARFDDVPDYRFSMAYNEHWRQFNAAQMMATIVSERTDGYVSFVGLCAENGSNLFSEAERSFKQMLMPHLSQALQMSRVLWTGRAAARHEAVGLVDREGWVLCTHGPFDSFVAEEWGHRVAQLPESAMIALKQTHRWCGASLDARLSTFGSNYFIHLSINERLPSLSPREREVAGLFASGMTNKQVARTLGTSPFTIRNQIVRIYEKLGISNKAELAARVSGA